MINWGKFLVSLTGSDQLYDALALRRRQSGGEIEFMSWEQAQEILNP